MSNLGLGVCSGVCKNKNKYELQRRNTKQQHETLIHSPHWKWRHPIPEQKPISVSQ